MITLGLDPSLRAFGWTLIDDNAIVLDKGTLGTDSDMIFIDRYITLRDQVRGIIQNVKSQYPNEKITMGVESPYFNDLFSEGMYGLFLYVNEAIKLELMDVVFLSPLQVKAHAHLFMGRPKGWKMQKTDMIDACKKADPTVKKLNHHQADAYWVARTSQRFWKFVNQDIAVLDLNDVEKNQFAKLDLNKMGQVKSKGIMYKEDDRWFRWSAT
jgi:Holliday junction resolvasome RuvABC endonuclease subunit